METGWIWTLPWGGSRRHLINMGSSGKRLAIDCSHLRRSGPIDGHEYKLPATALSALAYTTTFWTLLEVAWSEVSPKFDPAPSKSRNARNQPARRIVPLGGQKFAANSSFAAEDSEVVRLGYRSRDVVPPPLSYSVMEIFMPGNSESIFACSRPRMIDRRVAEFLDRSRGCCLSIGERRIPQTARTLHDQLHLCVGQRRTVEVGGLRFPFASYPPRTSENRRRPPAACRT